MKKRNLPQGKRISRYVEQMEFDFKTSLRCKIRAVNWWLFGINEEQPENSDMKTFHDEDFLYVELFREPFEDMKIAFWMFE